MIENFAIMNQGVEPLQVDTAVMQTIVGGGASGGVVLEGRAVCVTTQGTRGEVEHTAARTRTTPPRPTHPYRWN